MDLGLRIVLATYIVSSLSLSGHGVRPRLLAAQLLLSGLLLLLLALTLFHHLLLYQLVVASVGLGASVASLNFRLLFLLGLNLFLLLDRRYWPL